jgi:hypothetical protein
MMKTYKFKPLDWQDCFYYSTNGLIRNKHGLHNYKTSIGYYYQNRKKGFWLRSKI